jgi:uroporphyrinogen III methyltransferase/synthase
MPTVLITRAAHQAEPLKSQLETLGFQTLLQPVVKILPPENWGEVDAAVRQLLHKESADNFDWLVFSSTNGVQFFFDRYKHLNNVKIAVVGEGTNQTLFERTGRYADVVPERFNADSVAEQLLSEANAGKRFFLFRADRGRDVLKRKLQEAGGTVHGIVIYRSVDVKEPLPEIIKAVENGQIDYATVTSSAVAGSLVEMFGKHLRNVKLVSISPLTSQTLCGLGFPPQYEAQEASMGGIVRVFQEKGI